MGQPRKSRAPGCPRVYDAHAWHRSFYLIRRLSRRYRAQARAQEPDQRFGLATDDQAGDGTTTATVLAYGIVKEGAKAVAAALRQGAAAGNVEDLWRLGLCRDRRRG